MASSFVVLFMEDRVLRRERVFRDRSQALDTLTDKELIARYRFPRQTILSLTDRVAGLIARPTERSYSLPAHIQVMTALRFFAKGEYLSEVADVHGISMSSASRIISSVSVAICEVLNNINFPTTNEINKVKDGFHKIAGFPNVVGAIDGTLIPIQGMAGIEEPTFVCRKGFHALNIQAVCDSELRFTNIVVRWPGSTHDAFILSNSCLPNTMETTNGWLLGDSGYPLKKWLITPVSNPSNQQEVNFNLAHTQTRNTVERAFGVLKSRFRCMHKTGGSLQFTPTKCLKIVEACFKLHNQALKDKLPTEVNTFVNIYHNDDIYVQQGNQTEGQAIRQRLIQRF